MTEARLIFEGASAALAAGQITDDEIIETARLVEAIAEENLQPDGTEHVDRDCHLAIAKAIRNTAIYNAIEHLWELRSTSPEAALLQEKARNANIKPVVDKHSAVLSALRARDPGHGPYGNALTPQPG